MLYRSHIPHTTHHAPHAPHASRTTHRTYTHARLEASAERATGGSWPRGFSSPLRSGGPPGRDRHRRPLRSRTSGSRARTGGTSSSSAGCGSPPRGSVSATSRPASRSGTCRGQTTSGPRRGRQVAPRVAQRHRDPRLCARLAECGRALDPARVPHCGVVRLARACGRQLRQVDRHPLQFVSGILVGGFTFPLFYVDILRVFRGPSRVSSLAVSQCRSLAVSRHRVEYYLFSTLSACVCGITRRMLTQRAVLFGHVCSLSSPSCLAMSRVF